MKRLLSGEATIPVVAVLSVGATIVVAATAFFFSTTSELAQRISGVQQVNTAQSEHIASTAATVEAVLMRLDHVDKTLDRIESKITGQPLSKIQNQ